MKAYKIFNISPSGALRSYNIARGKDGDEVEYFSPVVLKYKPGEWREPEIEGTGIFCLNNIPTIGVNSNCELWEVEAEGQIGFEELVFESFMSGDKEDIRSKAENKKYATRYEIEELLFIFPNTVVFKRIKPIRKIKAGGAA
jgi:hypothetical protein